MSFRARIQTSLMFLFMTALVLQGCSVSGGGGDGAAGASGDGDAINLSLTTADGTFTLVNNGTDSVVIQMTATDGSGNGIAATPVRFTTTAGTLVAGGAVGPATTRAVVSEATDNTDTNGVAAATLTASLTVETATVIAELLGFSQAITISFVSGIPAQITSNAVPSILAPSGATTIQTIVRTVDGTAIEGVVLEFALTTNNSGATILPTAGTTDPDGQVTISYTAGALVGTDIVTASVGSLTGTVAIAVQVDTVVPSSIQLFVSPSPQLNSDKDPKDAGCQELS